MKTSNTTMQQLKLVVVAALILISSPLHAQYQMLDRVIVLVNDDLITAGELKKEIEVVRKQLLEQRTTLPDDAILQRQVLERMIMTRIQSGRAEQYGIRVSDEVLNQTINTIAAQNKLTLSEFRRALAKQGFEYADYREFIRSEKQINDLQSREVVSRIVVSDREINDAIANQTRLTDLDASYLLSHILISIPEAATPEIINEKKARGLGLLKRLNMGTGFADLAASSSDGQQALQGGSLGWRKMAELPSLFVEQVNQLKVGEVSELIRSPSGFHIVKLVDKKSEVQKHIISQTKARHILIKPDTLISDRSAEDRLKVLLERIKDGESFSELAKSNSDDPGSASNGGDLGWVSPDTMVPAFQKVMDSLKEKEISEPFKSRFGWHVVQVMERRKYDSTEEWMRNSARESIHRRKANEEIELWMRRIRDEAFVEYRLEK